MGPEIFGDTEECNGDLDKFDLVPDLIGRPFHLPRRVQQASPTDLIQPRVAY
jgi:hypothetical protein